MKKTAGFLAAVATFALAAGAEAQICAGYPTSDRGMYFGGRADFPEDLDSYGVEANYNFSGPLGVYGGLNVISADGNGEDEESEDEIYGGLAFEVASLGLMIGPRVSACPVIEARYMDFEGVGNFVQIPIGFGVGAGLGLPMLPSASAYVQPQLVITRFDFDNDLTDTETETETDFGIKAGANIGFGLINVGGEVRHIFVDDSDPVFGIRVGIRL